MGASELNRQIDHALAQLHEALGRGRSDRLQQYLQLMARLPRYSLGNLLLIGEQCPEARHVAGVGTWRQLGRRIKRGERGIRILAPIHRRKRARQREHEHKTTDADAEPTEELQGFRAGSVGGFRPVVVFDVGQTYGRPLPELARAKGEPGEHLARLEGYIQRLGIELEHLPPWVGAEGVSSGGEIAIRSDLEPAEHLSVLVHELAHELIHQCASEQGSASHTAMETEAEAVAFVVGQSLGLELTTAAADYIQLHGGDRATLTASLSRIQHIARRILEGMASGDASSRAG